MITYYGTAGTPLRVEVIDNVVLVPGTALPREKYQYGGSVMLVAGMTTMAFRDVVNLGFVSTLDASTVPGTGTVLIDEVPA